MCLAVPGKVVEWIDRESTFASAAVEFGGVRRHVNMALVPEANEGDYVLVHAGVAISCIDADEAAKVFETLNELALAESDETDALATQEPPVRPGDAE
jgi:hydrogenase expression/formation protein HypC